MNSSNHNSFLLIFISFIISFPSFANGLFFSVKINTEAANTNTVLKEYIILKQTKEYLITGLFPQYVEAMKAKQTIQAYGYQSIEILAFFNHTLISIEDAFSLMDNRNEQDLKNKGILLSEEDIQELLASVQDDEFFYTVQMGLFTEKNINAFFEVPKQLDEQVKAKGSLRYTYGNFKTYKEAKAVLETVKAQGLNDAFIVAFDSLERIPIERALAKEKIELEK